MIHISLNRCHEQKPPKKSWKKHHKNKSLQKTLENYPICGVILFVIRPLNGDIFLLDYTLYFLLIGVSSDKIDIKLAHFWNTIFLLKTHFFGSQNKFKAIVNLVQI